jgi:hypothetical protein
MSIDNPVQQDPLPLEIVEAWWIATWPRFKLYEERKGAYKNRALAIRKWWANATPRDIDRAREVLARNVIERAIAQREEGERMNVKPPSAAARRAAMKIVGGARPRG